MEVADTFQTIPTYQIRWYLFLVSPGLLRDIFPGLVRINEELLERKVADPI
jgi:hypothetical protein